MNNISSSPNPEFRPARSPKGKEKEIAKEQRASKKIPKQIEKTISLNIVSNADGSLKERKAIHHFREDLEVTSLANANLKAANETSSYQPPAEPRKWLPGELKEKLQERDLKHIHKKQSQIAKSNKSASPIFSADPLGDSANPVGLIKKPIYLPKSALTSDSYPSFPMIAQIIKQSYTGLKGPRSRVAFKQKAIWQLNGLILKIYENNSLTPKEKFDRAQMVFASFKQNYLHEKADDSYEFRDAILKLEKEFLKISPLKDEEIEKIPALYNIEEVINQLTIQLLAKRIPHEKAQAILALKKELLGMQEAFIPVKDLEKLMAAHVEIKPKLTQYLSSYDILATLGNTPMVRMQIARSAGEVDHPGYALKLGNETKRELLARKIIQVFGFEKTFYHLKTEARLPNTSVKGLAAKNAIASNIIEAVPISHNRAWLESWKKFQKAEQRLHAAQFQGKSQEEIANLEHSRNMAAKRLKSFGGAESIPTHVLMSALLGGYDEHLGQFIPDLATNELIDIDFSRFLPAAPYLQSRDSRNPETFFIFRNIFLNHPFAKENLPFNIVKQIENWNLTNMAKEIAPLVGNQDAMEADYQKLQDIFHDISVLKKYDSLIEEDKDSHRAVAELLVKYGITPSLDLQFTPEQQRQLYHGLVQESNRLRLKNFDYIHYKGAQEMLARMDTLQTYVRSTPNPSAYGAFSAMYPEIMPFMDYLQRIPRQSEVGEDISMEALKGETKPRPLESILKEAENTLKHQFGFEKKEASAEENRYRHEQSQKLQAQIDAMRRSLESIRANPRFRDELALSMDLS